MTTFFISDTHFYHHQLIKYDNRPFEDVDKMNQTLIEKWNARVKPDDTIYILGDMFAEFTPSKDMFDVLEQLNGKKRYILGNHDDKILNMPFEMYKYFDSIENYKELTLDGVNVILSHYPYVADKYEFTDDDSLFLYGHVHNSKTEDITTLTRLAHLCQGKTKNYSLNVGCMMPYMNYEPKTLAELLSIAKDHQSELLRLAQDTDAKAKTTELLDIVHKLNTSRDV